MSNEWDKYAGGWDSDEEVVEYSRKAFHSLGEMVSPENLKVLDFGCGTGCTTEKLAPLSKSVVGLDTSLAMLAVLEGKGLANVVTIGDELSDELVDSHPLFRPKFDLIFASSVCGFLKDYEGALRLLKSLLEKDGWFVQWDWLATGADPGSGFTKEAVQSALEGAGFEKVEISVPFSMVSSQVEMAVLMGVGKNV